MAIKIGVYDTDTRVISVQDPETLGLGFGSIAGEPWQVPRERSNGAGLDLSPLLLIDDDNSMVTATVDLTVGARFFGGFVASTKPLGVMRGADVALAETLGTIRQCDVLEADDVNQLVRVNGVLQITGEVQDGDGNPKSLQGPEGEAGAKGDKGDKGDTGDAGAKGDKGDKGDTGDAGAQGAQGIQGIQGAQGAQGIQGVAGANGGNYAYGTGVYSDEFETGALGAGWSQLATAGANLAVSFSRSHVILSGSTAGANVGKVCGIYRNIAGAGTWRYQASCVNLLLTSGGVSGDVTAGLMLYDGAKIQLFGQCFVSVSQSKHILINYTDAATFASEPASIANVNFRPFHYAIEKTATEYRYEVSYDVAGAVWFRVATIATGAAFLVSTKVGLGMNASNAAAGFSFCADDFRQVA